MFHVLSESDPVMADSDNRQTMNTQYKHQSILPWLLRKIFAITTAESIAQHVRFNISSPI